MEFMREMPDKAYEMAIVDPPYGIGADNHHQWATGGKAVAPKGDYGSSQWDSTAPSKDYFEELFRVSKNQIIWGANHFIDRMAIPSSCWIVWDKVNGSNPFADFEMAWTSFSTVARLFRFQWQGMLQGDMKNKERRIHPTQKPVRLYEWLLQNYAKPGDKILDTHLGSGSSAIAAYNTGFDFTGYEIDADYFQAAKERLERHMKQERLFEPQMLAVAI